MEHRLVTLYVSGAAFDALDLAGIWAQHVIAEAAQKLTKRTGTQHIDVAENCVVTFTFHPVRPTIHLWTKQERVMDLMHEERIVLDAPFEALTVTPAMASGADDHVIRVRKTVVGGYDVRCVLSSAPRQDGDVDIASLADADRYFRQVLGTTSQGFFARHSPELVAYMNITSLLEAMLEGDA